MNVDEIAKLPHLNPTRAELLARISNLRGSRRAPTSMAMSPETWERLKREDDEWLRDRTRSTEVMDALGPATREVGGERTFRDIPVRLYEECLGVAIGYTQT